MISLIDERMNIVNAPPKNSRLSQTLFNLLSLKDNGSSIKWICSIRELDNCTFAWKSKLESTWRTKTFRVRWMVNKHLEGSGPFLQTPLREIFNLLNFLSNDATFRWLTINHSLFIDYEILWYLWIHTTTVLMKFKYTFSWYI